MKRQERRGLKIGVSVLLGISLGIFFHVRAPEAAQVKRVEHKTTEFGAGDLVILPDLDAPMDTTKSFILQYAEVDLLMDYGVRAKAEYGGEGSGMFSSYFEDIATLNVVRLKASDTEYSVTGTVRNSMVEFSDGAKVFTGLSSVASDKYNRTIILPESVNLSKSFPLYTTRGIVMQADETETQFFKMTFVNSTALKIERYRLPTATGYTAAPVMSVQWQVVELTDDAIVHNG
ncbi:MAG: hypothetical protein KKC84_00295, partial [Candidatus Omnitrophica bacterium]|nr:hypothetical protein [Candidatus Omnitrophota bacterium]